MNVPSTFSERLDAIHSRIHAACARAGRTSDDITLVAVSKTKPVEMLQEAFEAGVRHFGENRVQEAATKIPHLPKAGLTWHLIGHLQSNKAKSAVELFDVIHSVDSIALATRLNRLAGEQSKCVPIFLQVHLGDEESKAGVDPAELPSLFQAATQLTHLKITGLMAIPPYFPDPQQVRPSFVILRQLRDQLAVQFPDQSPLPFLSMGMSHDFEVAIEEGATHVRVGTALFGGRS